MSGTQMEPSRIPRATGGRRMGGRALVDVGVNGVEGINIDSHEASVGPRNR